MNVYWSITKQNCKQNETTTYYNYKMLCIDRTDFFLRKENSENIMIYYIWIELSTTTALCLECDLHSLMIYDSGFSVISELSVCFLIVYETLRYTSRDDLGFYLLQN